MTHSHAGSKKCAVDPQYQSTVNNWDPPEIRLYMNIFWWPASHDHISVWLSSVTKVFFIGLCWASQSICWKTWIVQPYLWCRYSSMSVPQEYSKKVKVKNIIYHTVLYWKTQNVKIPSFMCEVTMNKITKSIRYAYINNRNVWSDHIMIW